MLREPARRSSPTKETFFVPHVQRWWSEHGEAQVSPPPLPAQSWLPPIRDDVQASASSVDQIGALSRKRTAELLRRLRTLQRDLRTLKVRVDTEYNRALHSRLRRPKAG
jgi:hypothetical protein